MPGIDFGDNAAQPPAAPTSAPDKTPGSPIPAAKGPAPATVYWIVAGVALWLLTRS